MLIAADAAGTQTPDFDELAVVTVTSPTNQVKKVSLVRYQATCSDPAGTTIQLTGSGPAVNITSLFGSETGTFAVDASP
ncbi:hypothetical protein [Sorangium sp. So ce1078]|uniref:hypothetical protein n=1 Tax=Sorangium sp. So ce1078 TaxID=3133329 RepID=UPI003F611DD5